MTDYTEALRAADEAAMDDAEYRANLRSEAAADQYEDEEVAR